MIIEKLGVPMGIDKETDRIYKIIFDNLNKLEFPEEIEEDEILLIRNTFIKINDLYSLIDIVLYLDYDEAAIKPKLISFGCGSKNQIQLINKKLFVKQKTNVFVITVSVGAINKKEIIDTIINVKKSIISHELMHFYDQYKNDKSGVDKTSQYYSYNITDFPPIISKFIYLIYYMTSFENIVRPSQIYKDLIDNNINKDQFYDFMESSSVIKMIKTSKNFSLNRFRDNLNKNLDVKQFLKNKNLLGDDSSYIILNMLFSSLLNNYTKIVDEFIKRYIDENNLSDKELDIVNNNFRKIISEMKKYEKNPIKYFEFLEKKLNFDGNNAYKKLYKLYDMVSDNKI